MKLSSIITRARELRRSGDMDFWQVALLASRVVDDGHYGEGAVDKLAKAIKRSGKTVYNLAGAWETYIALRQVFEKNKELWPMYKKFSSLRSRLPYTHFKTMGDLMRRFEFDPTEAISYLVDAAELEHSARRMQEDIEAEQKTERPPDKKSEFKKSTAKAVYELEQASMNAPTDDLAAVVIAASKVVKQAMEQQEQSEPYWVKQSRLVHSIILDLLKAKKLPTSLYQALVCLADELGKVFDNTGEK